MTTGGPAIKFDTPGQVSTIVVRKVTEKVDTDPATNQVKTWPNGDPKMVFVFDGEDEQGDPVSLWVRGNMVKAIREATSAAGLKTVIDTRVTIKFDSLGDQPNKALKPPKLFKAKVEAVAPAVVTAAFGETYTEEEPF
jgi:hypothetical protein